MPEAGIPQQAAPAAPAQGQSAPMGVSSVTGPTPNRGYEAAVQQRLGVYLPKLIELIPMAGAGSEVGQALLDAVKKLSKFVQPGSSSPAAEQNELQRAQQQNAQNRASAQQMGRPQMPGQGAMPPGGPPMQPRPQGMAA